MPRILVLNNYSLERVQDEVRKGLKPSHHLFGIDYLMKKGYEIKIIPFQHSRFLHYLQKIYGHTRIPVPLGDLDQQFSVLRILDKEDMIYAPCQTQAQLLCYLRTMGVIKVPIICLAHHPFNRGGLLDGFRKPFNRLYAQGADAFPSLSRKVAEEINALNRNGTESRVVTYGPDIAFYNYQPREGEGVIAAGRTGRDFETFGSAASQTNVKTTIICPQRSVSPSFTKFSDNIRLIADKYEEHMNYRELVDLYANARVIAIPLYEGHSLLGLNSLTDALGMGKPIIMTRNPFIDLDIESLGIGRWVDPGDVPGWKNAIQWFDDHANEAVEMGSRARRLAEERINYATFCYQIADIIDKALNNV